MPRPAREPSRQDFLSLFELRVYRSGTVFRVEATTLNSAFCNSKRISRMRMRILASILHSHSGSSGNKRHHAGRNSETDAHGTETRTRFRGGDYEHDTYACAPHKGSRQQDLHSEPTIHQPRPPERRVLATGNRGALSSSGRERRCKLASQKRSGFFEEQL
jgi:hypothetical protein